MELKEGWYEKLCRWDDALEAYTRRCGGVWGSVGGKYGGCYMKLCRGDNALQVGEVFKTVLEVKGI